MAEFKHRHPVLLTALAAVILLATTSPLWGARIGRHIAWLSVERVEVTGTRLLAPEEVIAVAGIEPGQPLLQEPDLWIDALRQHPVIADVSVTRWPPRTLRIHVIEKLPVALVSDGTLRLATASGEILPVDPHAAPLDLPIVHGSFQDSASAAAAHATLAETDRLTVLAPALMRQVSEIRAEPGEDSVLRLSHAAAEILVPAGAPLLRLEELKIVLADLERRFPASDAEDTRRHRHHVDLRFDDQVVVRPSNPDERS